MRGHRTRSRRLLITAWDGIPVYADWSLPLGALIVAGFAGFTASAWLGFVALVLAHELGHAALVRRYGLRVKSIHLHGGGGECEYEGAVTEHQESVIAWGGVLGQAVLFVAVFLPVHLGLVPEVVATSGFVAVTVGYSMFVATFNLLPMRGLDGEHAWRIFRAAAPRTHAPSAKEIADKLITDAIKEASRVKRERPPR